MMDFNQLLRDGDGLLVVDVQWDFSTRAVDAEAGRRALEKMLKAGAVIVE